MGIAQAVISTLTTFGPFGGQLLRGYLRIGGPVPRRARWIVGTLKRQLLPDSTERVVGIGSGLRLRVDVKSSIGREIYFHGSYEPELAVLLRQVLRPGMTVFDAGANLGELAIRAARLVGPRGRVYALEASPETIRSLRENIELNRLENVRLVHAAVGDFDEARTFYLGREEDSLTSSLTQPHDFEGRCATVEGLRLDRLAEREGLGRVDLIKLDVEGAELAALRGARELLAHSAPLVVFEYNRDVAERAGWDLGAILDLMRPLGYAIHRLAGRGIGPEIAGSAPVMPEGLAKQDLVAVPPTWKGMAIRGRDARPVRR